MQFEASLAVDQARARAAGMKAELVRRESAEAVEREADERLRRESEEAAQWEAE